jgi:hypothetical protein
LEADAKKAHCMATCVETDCKGLKRTYNTYIQSYTHFNSKVEAAIDLGSPAKKKKQNRHRPPVDGDGVGMRTDLS